MVASRPPVPEKLNNFTVVNFKYFTFLVIKAHVVNPTEVLL
jgi:hypothetical protein